MTGAICFVWFFTAGLWTVNALRRPVPPGRRFPPLWLPGMIVSELAPWLFLARAGIALLFVLLGAIDNTLGALGLILFGLGQLGLLLIVARSLRANRRLGLPVRSVTVLKVWEGLPPEVTHTSEVAYWQDLTLDIYTKGGVSDAPTLLYVHPGSWMRGRPGRQARPMFHLLAKAGWVVLDIRYPLSPRATFPEHLVGVKRAIAWARGADGLSLGVDPGRLYIAGGSSGAHLAALAALTSHRTDLQPGFESADTSVDGAVVLYGIYDLFVRNPTRYDWPFIARHVFKASRHEAPDLYRLGSPIDQVHPEAPPFLVIHGEFDSVVLPEESKQFAMALETEGVPSEYVEVVGAQHGFDAIAGLRGRAIGEFIGAWLDDATQSAAK